jgi:MoaA/NifB/PqqE/SkfB family radical SAM enzyme
MTGEKAGNTKNGKSANSGIGPLVRKGLWLWGRSGWRRMGFLCKAGLRVRGANQRRRRLRQELGGAVPTVLVASVTMHCNYDCQGCYSRGRPETDELSEKELDTLFLEAEAMGFLAVVVTGGEPLLRSDILEIIKRHPQLLFVMITNGSFLTPEKARVIANLSNLLVLVSIEGSPADTDGRRGAGAHAAALEAMLYMQRAGAFFGFAVTNNMANSEYLGSDMFIAEVIRLGCTVGLITEYVPCGPRPRRDWIMDEDKRAAFRSRIEEIRSSKPIVLVQFPHDEYGDENLCTGAGRASLHINAQGGVEPCPFVPVSRDSIRRGGLRAAITSPFLQAIRDRRHLLSRQNLACSLFEHLAEVETLAGGFEPPADQATESREQKTG